MIPVRVGQHIGVIGTSGATPAAATTPSKNCVHVRQAGNAVQEGKLHHRATILDDDPGSSIIGKEIDDTIPDRIAAAVANLGQNRIDVQFVALRDREIGDRVARVTQRQIDEGIGPRPAGQHIGTCATDQDVIARTRRDDIRARAAVQLVVGTVADDLVVAAAGAGVLDHRTARNREVPVAPADVGVCLGDQAQVLVQTLRTEVDQIDATAVDNRHRILPRQIHAQASAGGFPVAVNGVSHLDIDGHPVKRLDRKNVAQLKRGKIGEIRVRVGVLVLREIGHNAGLPTVIGITSVGFVIRRAVVVARVPQT